MTRIIEGLGRGSRLNLAAFALAFAALFVALGGASYAGGLAKNTVKSKNIIDGQVKSGDLADGGVKSADLQDNGVGLIDLSAATKVALMEILDGSVTTPKLADGAVTTPKLGDAAVDTTKLADNAVNSAKVVNESLTEDDLGPNSVRASEIANNSIDSGEIVNGGLNGVDIGKTSGTETYDPPNIGAGDCDYQLVPVSGGVTTADQVTVSPEADFNPETSPAVVYGQASVLNDNIRIVVCNPSNAAVDLPSTTFHYTVIEN
jgi:hypothetical protein